MVEQFEVKSVTHSTKIFRLVPTLPYGGDVPSAFVRSNNPRDGERVDPGGMVGKFDGDTVTHR